VRRCASLKLNCGRTPESNFFPSSAEIVHKGNELPLTPFDFHHPTIVGRWTVENHQDLPCGNGNCNPSAFRLFDTEDLGLQVESFSRTHRNNILDWSEFMSERALVPVVKSSLSVETRYRPTLANNDNRSCILADRMSEG